MPAAEAFFLLNEGFCNQETWYQGHFPPLETRSAGRACSSSAYLAAVLRYQHRTIVGASAHCYQASNLEVVNTDKKNINKNLRKTRFNTKKNLTGFNWAENKRTNQWELAADEAKVHWNVWMTSLSSSCYTTEILWWAVKGQNDSSNTRFTTCH